MVWGQITQAHFPDASEVCGVVGQSFRGTNCGVGQVFVSLKAPPRILTPVLSPFWKQLIESRPLNLEVQKLRSREGAQWAQVHTAHLHTHTLSSRMQLSDSWLAGLSASPCQDAMLGLGYLVVAKPSRTV